MPDSARHSHVPFTPSSPAFVFLIYALVVRVLLLLVAACLAPQEASWMPATLRKYFPWPAPMPPAFSARPQWHCYGQYARGLPARPQRMRRPWRNVRGGALCAERLRECHSGNRAIESVDFAKDRGGCWTGIVQASLLIQPRQP